MDFNLEQFTREVLSRKKYVDSCLKEYLNPEDTYPALIHEAMHYAVFNGGKRLRPIMVLEGAVIAGGKKEKVIPAACAIEMIHSYSLVHDDLPAMDDDDFRRGKPTCHKAFGEANAILTGDALLTAAFELLAGTIDKDETMADNLIRVIALISRAAGSRGMIGGQVLDLESEGKNIDYETLKTLHTLKTGELFRASLKTGAILCDMEESGLEALDNYSRHFGLAFQISDDILDVKGDESFTGKPVGSDEKNLKITYPKLFGLDKAYELAQESVKNCIDSLKIFGNEADFLRQLACFTIKRNS